MLIGRTVAIKFLHARYLQSDSVVSRFYREAKAAAAVGHKIIIDVLDVGVCDGEDPSLIMESLEGESLDSALRRTGPMDIPTLCAVMEPVLSALKSLSSTVSRQ